MYEGEVGSNVLTGSDSSAIDSSGATDAALSVTSLSTMIGSASFKIICSTTFY